MDVIARPFQLFLELAYEQAMVCNLIEDVCSMTWILVLPCVCREEDWQEIVLIN